MVIASKLFGCSKIPPGQAGRCRQPRGGTYRAGDDRFISLILLQSDKHWADFVNRLGVPGIATDPRFADSAARAENAGVRGLPRRGVRPTRWPTGRRCRHLRRGLGAVPDARRAVRRRPGPGQRLPPPMTAANGEEVALVASPAQFDEEPVAVTRAPSTASTPSWSCWRPATTGTASAR